MRKLLAILLTTALLLSALPAVGLADMELDVEESELEDFGEGEGYAAENQEEEEEPDEEEEADELNLDEMDEDELSAMEDDGSAFEYDFGGEGYTGTWVKVPGQDMQFCLPDGWVEIETEKALYAARKEDKTASMTITLKAEDVDDVQQWIVETLKPGTPATEQTAGFYSAMVIYGKKNNMSVYISTDSGKVLQFAFKRKTEDALEESIALNIVSSLYEDWFDDEDMMNAMEAEARQ